MSGCHAGLLILLSTFAASAQSVISVRSGLINFSDGAVFIDTQPVEKKVGRYPSLKEGSQLITEDGRAEILLTPNAYLRVGQNSAVRMISTDLSDTQVELESGSAILDSGNALSGAPVTLIVRNTHIRAQEPIRLRIDADPPQLRVYKGKADVLDGSAVTHVGADQLLPLAGSSVVQRMTDASDDLLDIWSQQRNRLIFFNLASAQNIGDPASAPAAYSASVDGVAWPAYLPLATIAPFGGLYAGGNIGGANIGAANIGAPLIYSYGIYAFPRYANSWPRPQFGYVPGYRFAPVYPGVSAPYRGIGALPRPITPGGGIGASRPIAPRPITPHVPAHR